MLPAAAAIGAAQLAVSAIPTKSDIERNKELARLQGLKDKGELGLTGGERAAYESAYMDPVKAQQGELGMRQEAQMAASGQTSGGQLARAQQMEQQNLAKAGQVAGRAIQQADVEKVKEQETKIDQLIADKAQKQRSLLDMAAGNIGAVGMAAGKNAAYAEYTKQLSPVIEGKLRDAGITDPGEIDDVLKALQTPEGMALMGKLGGI